LNGRRGHITGRETSNGRIPVLVDGESNSCGVKFSNVVWLPDEYEDSTRAQAVDGALIEKDGRTMSFFLDTGRIISNDMMPVVPGLSDDMNAIYHLRQTPKGLMQISMLTARMYSLWYENAKKNGDGVYANLRYNANSYMNSPDIASHPNFDQFESWAELLKNKELESWGDKKYRISGNFWIVEMRNDGAVMASMDNSGMVCLVLGIAEPIVALLQRSGVRLPHPVALTLLPFKGRLVYDGVLVGPSIEVQCLHLESLKKE
jgi:hypothetical protein